MCLFLFLQGFCLFFVCKCFFVAGFCLCGGSFSDRDQKRWPWFRLSLGSSWGNHRSLYWSVFGSHFSFNSNRSVFILKPNRDQRMIVISNWASGRELGKTSPDAPLYIFGATSLIGKHVHLLCLDISMYLLEKRIINLENTLVFSDQNHIHENNQNYQSTMFPQPPVWSSFCQRRRV